ncbi:MAG: type II secretion system protein [Candidatus Delongbacteria bacterium]|jgi:prepilin-type N-terminal cleavage/methylation domain-containing protein|nr:type II secretion system protein [Candidatus Delongbacteria bacterium]
MKKGMTLIELLVSALILAIGITALMYSFVVCNRIIMDNTHKVNAISTMNLYFEGVQRRGSLAEVQSFLGGGVDAPIKVSCYVGSETFWNYWLEFDLSSVVTPDPNTDLVVVIATVSWDKKYVSEGSNKSLSMVMFTNEPEVE